jgi:putative tricarboxylic transport membrane protein
MDLLASLTLGFAEILTPQNLLFCFVGALLGTAIGVLPGLGPAPTIAMLLPATYALEPVSALVMLAGIFYGSQYGGSTTAILVNLPGESTSVVTTLDGHQMARQGRAGPALAIAAIGSFVAGTLATLIIAVSAPSLATLGLAFGPADYFSLMVVALLCALALARGSMLKALGVVLSGLVLGLVGMDANSGVRRFTFGLPDLSDGIEFVALAMGFFAFGEVVKNMAQGEAREVVTTRVTGLMPGIDDLKVTAPAILRGTAIGSLLGVLPGGGAILATWTSYALEKRLASDPSRFGHGAIEGVAAPESANNAAVQTSFIPMLTLGIPSSATMALMMGAMMIHGIAPGPRVMETNPGVFWGLIASMWVGNLMLLVLNLPLVGLWVRLLRVPFDVLSPLIVVICCIGIFSINGKVFDLWVAGLFGLVAFVFARLDCEPAPLLLGFVLGPLMEENFRRALLMSRGDPSVFFTSGISAVLLGGAALIVLMVMLPAMKRRRDTVFQGD